MMIKNSKSFADISKTEQQFLFLENFALKSRIAFAGGTRNAFHSAKSGPRVEELSSAFAFHLFEFLFDAVPHNKLACLF